VLFSLVTIEYTPFSTLTTLVPWDKYDFSYIVPGTNIESNRFGYILILNIRFLLFFNSSSSSSVNE